MTGSITFEQPAEDPIENELTELTKVNMADIFHVWDTHQVLPIRYIPQLLAAADKWVKRREPR